jgi:CheY-like chemotaxis protein
VFTAKYQAAVKAVDLPVKHSHSTIERKQYWESIKMPSKRVLVVDDEADVRAVVCGCLEDIAGWEVVVASSGLEGLDKVQSQAPDAIVLDVMMPGMDGLEFLRRLKANTNIDRIPVVLLTAKVSLIDSNTTAELGVAGAIAKPFNPLLLSQQIAAFLGWE